MANASCGGSALNSRTKASEPILNPTLSSKHTRFFLAANLANAAIAASRVGAIVVLNVARHRTPNLKMRILNLI
jgi:hypothetical protein